MLIKIMGVGRNFWSLQPVAMSHPVGSNATPVTSEVAKDHAAALRTGWGVYDGAKQT